MRSTTKRRPHLAVLALSLTTAITVAGCASSSGSDASEPGTSKAKAASPTAPKGVVTKEFAESALSTYEKTNNKANDLASKARTVQARELLSKVEGGQLNEQSQADYAQWKTWSAKEQKDYGTPFFYTDRQYVLPREGTATWFAVVGKSSSSDEDQALMIFDRVGGTYKMVASVYAESTPLPEVAVDRNGLATAVDPSRQVGALAPEDLAVAFEDLFETGGKHSGAQLASTRPAKESVGFYKDRNDNNGGKATSDFTYADPAHPKVYALELKNGGVLTLFPTAHTVTRSLKGAYASTYEIDPSKAEAVYNPLSRDTITDEQQGQALAVLTPSGKPQVIAREYRLVDSR
ncbi:MULTISPECIES: hypothetical protein [Streptomyces]|uniref:hypothetical protein n=1 Tax=Streptomyces TaxID=1883 RepID=UPI000E68D053|nr:MULTISPECIES: hypothetical protein [Streptomyces]MDX3066253.1 hypothetical protein [Streptomyces sp. ND04-05B]MDX3519636.1 hypothetical protein [Streptomyces scabiei]